MSSDQHPAETVTVLANDGYCRTEAITWADHDGTHIRIRQHYKHLNGRESDEIVGIKPGEIPAVAEMFAKVADDNSGGSLAAQIRDVRRALADFHTAGGGDSNDAEIDAALALAAEVDALLSHRLTRASLALNVVICGCGDAIEKHGDAWFHRGNPALIGHDDEQINVEELGLS